MRYIVWFAFFAIVTLAACGHTDQGGEPPPERQQESADDPCMTQYGAQACADNHTCFKPSRYGRNNLPEECVPKCPDGGKACWSGLCMELPGRVSMYCVPVDARSEMYRSIERQADNRDL